MNYQIFSTKGLYGAGGIVLWIIIGVLFAPIFLVDSIIATIVLIGYGVLIGIPIGKEVGMKQSYIELYDDHIIGKTIPQKIFNAANEQYVFELNYKEIIRMDYKRNIVVIYTSTNKYEVQAKAVEQKVINIIKAKQNELNNLT